MKNEEKKIGPLPFDEATKWLSNLIKESKAFKGGSRPFVGRLGKSYGNGKVIGIESFDQKVRTRLDYNPVTGFHFNFDNFENGDRYAILIDDMTEEQYKKYIDKLSKGRSKYVTPKMPNFKFIKDISVYDSSYIETKQFINKTYKELYRDIFVQDYYNKLLDMYSDSDIDYYNEEIKCIISKNNKLDTKIKKNLLYLEYYCLLNDVEFDISDLHRIYIGDNYTINNKEDNKLLKK